MGLVNSVVASEGVTEAALALARRLAEGPGLALRMTKRMLDAEWTMALRPAMEAEAQAQALMMLGLDHREFHQAFVAKRPPKFKGC